MILCRNQGHLPTFGPALLHLYGSTRDYWFVDKNMMMMRMILLLMTMEIMMMLHLYGSMRDYWLVDE